MFCNCAVKSVATFFSYRMNVLTDYILTSTHLPGVVTEQRAYACSGEILVPKPALYHLYNVYISSSNI